MPEWKPESRRRLAGVKLQPARETAIVEELAQYLDDHYAELLASGATEAEAYRQPLEELSGSEMLAQEARRVERQVPQEPIVLVTNRRTNIIAALWQDLRFRVRRLMKQHGLILIAILTLAMGAGFTQVKTTTIPLEDFKMQSRNVRTEWVTYKGRRALRVTDIAPASVGGIDRLIILSKTEFQDGMIELELTGEPSPNAGEGARGFVGVAFRVLADTAPGAAKDASKYECFYLRPTNGRADDQVRRNHSVQYISFPDFPWHRLRKEFPEKYESYVDIVPGEWTKVKFEVRGEKARLYVHGASQPVLVVNDLKHGRSQGRIALSIGPGTVAHFTDLRVSK
jgi:hypothetical protein